MCADSVGTIPMHEASVKSSKPSHPLYTLRWGGIVSSQSARIGLNRPPASLPAPLAPTGENETGVPGTG